MYALMTLMFATVLILLLIVNRRTALTGEDDRQSQKQTNPRSFQVD